jgi:hypothetical protein
LAEVVARIVTRQSADEIRPFVVRILKGIAACPEVERVVGQRRFYVLQGDRALETKFRRRFVERGDGH